MAYTYASWVTALASAAVTSATDTDFVAILPSVIDYVEQRCYRELDLLSTSITDTSASTTANTGTFTLPSSIGRFVRVDQINIISPSGATATTGTRNPVLPATREYIDFTWPNYIAPSATTVPDYFAMLTDQTVRFGPSPGAVFAVEVRGTIRPTPLSASNTTTALATYLPDLFFAASMVFIAGWQKNFGAQSDDPRMASSWETQFQGLLQSAKAEEMGKKLIGVMTGAAA